MVKPLEDWEVVEGSFFHHMLADCKAGKSTAQVRRISKGGAWCGFPYNPNLVSIHTQRVTCVKCLQLEISHGKFVTYKHWARERLKVLGHAQKA